MSGEGLVSEALLFEEDFLNSFGVGIGLSKEGRGCRDRKVEETKDISGQCA